MTGFSALIVEDSPGDALLMLRVLGRRCAVERHAVVDDLETLRDALRVGSWDVVLSDATLPGFSAEEALEAVRETHPELPFVVVSGTIGEERAFELFKRGANAFVPKSDLSKLPEVVESELSAARHRRELRRAELREIRRRRLEGLEVMAGGIAHDFNNILTVTVGRINLALDELPPDSQARKELQHALRSAMQAAALTRQILTLAGKSVTVRQPVHVNELLVRSLPVLQRACSGKCALRLQLGDAVAPVWADPTQLEQMVLHLVTNAAEAMGSNHGEVVVRLESCELRASELDRLDMVDELEAGSYVSLTVTDDGAGIDDQTRERLFEPFVSSKFLGRGLGLPAVFGIVRGHEGGIEIQSRPGEGTTVRVLLPARKEFVRIERVEEPIRRPAPAGRTVLVVDEEPDLLELARRALAGAGFTVLTARDGDEALEIFERDPERVALAILDQRATSASGEDLAHSFLARRSGTRVVVASGSELGPSETRDGDSSFVLLPKPFTIGTLVELARRLTDERETQPTLPCRLD